MVGSRVMRNTIAKQNRIGQNCLLGDLNFQVWQYKDQNMGRRYIVMMFEKGWLY